MAAICSSVAVKPAVRGHIGTGVRGLRALPAVSVRPAARVVRVRAAEEKAQVIKPLNGDPFIGMLETPVTSAPVVAGYLSNLPAYRIGVSPLLRGVEIGLAHGFLLAGPFIKLGPLRDTDAGIVSGCLSAGGLVAILTVCLTIYGAATFQGDEPEVGVKTLTGREVPRDPLQSSEGWSNFTSGFLVGGVSGVAWAYICTQILPFYS
mmetsp:Transcript_22551/g.40157  ORF Transcript_22551/g.40157 Transcript_22551/m.40157 type:complete len:206 (-) Transcript_22551:146-763(-)